MWSFFLRVSQMKMGINKKLDKNGGGKMDQRRLAKSNWKRKTVIFLTSQNISLFGTSLVQYAIMWYITIKTQSGFMMTISIICGFLPTFFLAPFAGVWADRFNRKWLIMLSDSMIALTTLMMAIVFWMGYESIWLLFAMSAIRAIGSAVQQPAVNAFIPQFVPENQLMRVGGINSSIQSVMMLIAPMVSGALMTIAPLQSIFMIDVVTAAFAVLILTRLSVPVHAKALEKGKINYLDDMKLGLTYVVQHEYIRRFYIFIAIFHFFITPVAALTPLQVTRSFGNDIWRLTAIEIAFSSGMLLGGLLISSWGGFNNRIHTMSLSTFGIGLMIVALGIVTNFWVYIGIMLISGVTLPLFMTPSTVLLQEKVEEAYMGRVFGVMTMIYSSAMPLGMLVFGPLADIVDIEWLLIVSGAVIFFQGFFLIGNKALVHAGKPKEIKQNI
jgi:Bacterial protein of unknown function (DUF894).